MKITGRKCIHVPFFTKHNKMPYIEDSQVMSRFKTSGKKKSKTKINSQDGTLFKQQPLMKWPRKCRFSHACERVFELVVTRTVEIVPVCGKPVKKQLLL